MAVHFGGKGDNEMPIWERALKNAEKDYLDWEKSWLEEERNRRLNEEAQRWKKMIEAEKATAQKKLDDMCKQGPPKAKVADQTNIVALQTLKDAVVVFKLATNAGFNAKLERLSCVYYVSWWA